MAFRKGHLCQPTANPSAESGPEAIDLIRQKQSLYHGDQNESFSASEAPEYSRITCGSQILKPDVDGQQGCAQESDD